MTLRRIRLELARDPQQPAGDARHGYELILPLNADGHIDAKNLAKHKSACIARRFAPGQEDEVGELIRTGPRHWAISYVEGDEDDEDIHNLEKHAFKTGDYLSIREHDGVMRTFRVAEVGEVAGIALHKR